MVQKVYELNETGCNPYTETYLALSSKICYFKATFSEPSVLPTFIHHAEYK